jgi:hypothetical protein
LLDRSILLELQRIPPHTRKPERALWEAFGSDISSILGGVFNTLATALRLYPTIRLTELPRMAQTSPNGGVLLREHWDIRKRNF